MMDFGFYNMDNMEGMAQFPDKYFDLAIVDPPYGIGASNDVRFGQQMPKEGSPRGNYKIKGWDNKSPDRAYFKLLKLKTKKQIIWGVNHYKNIDLTGGRLFWHKKTIIGHTSSDGELAYLSFKSGIDYVYILWNGAYQYDMKNKELLIHPTQKPVALYRWLLQNYAKPGDIILDTHAGSLSSGIACEWEGFDYVAFELDEDYYRDATKRLQQWRESRTIDMFPSQQVERDDGVQEVMDLK